MKRAAVLAFGHTLRAYRLGYHVSDRLQAFVRICDVTDTTFNITLVPLYDKVPNSKGNHRCWWECQNPDALFADMPALKHVKKVKRTISFDVDMNGERILR